MDAYTQRALTAAATEPFDSPFPVPEYPPREWFDGPPDWVEDWRRDHGLGPSRDASTGIMKLTVTDDGRVGGWFYEHGQCIVHQQDACPGPSPTRYAAFHQQDVILDDGSAMQVGVIGNTHGHASPWLDYVQAQRHYADPDAQMIVCRAGDDERGGWIAGSIVPGLSFADVAMLRRSGLSGDWRPMPSSWWKSHGVTAAQVRQAEGYDCVGPTLVTRPALPLVKSFAASVGARAAAILGGAAGIQLADEVMEVARMATTRVTLPDGTLIESFGGPAASMAALTAAASGSTDLPIAERDTAWDGAAAERRVREMASSDGSGDPDTMDWASYGRAFLYRDPAAAGTFGAYKLGFADVINGQLQIVPKGVFAVAGALQGARGGVAIPAADKETIRGKVNAMYGRMADKFGDASISPPWQAAVSAPTDLPIGARELPWDPAAAMERVRLWASSDGSGDPETIDWSNFDRAFFFRNDNEMEDPFAAYALGFADIVDGELVAVPEGIIAAAETLATNPGDVPEAQVDQLKANVAVYYQRMAEQFGDDSIQVPWEAEMEKVRTAQAGDEAMGDAMPGGEDMGGEAMTETPEQAVNDVEALTARLDDLETRVAALEEWASAQLEAQVAALLAEDKPLPQSEA